jgi:hypothetical protein
MKLSSQISEEFCSYFFSFRKHVPFWKDGTICIALCTNFMVHFTALSISKMYGVELWDDWLVGDICKKEIIVIQILFRNLHGGAEENRQNPAEFRTVLLPSTSLEQHRPTQFSELTNIVLSEWESGLLYDWPYTAKQFALTPSPLRLTARILFQLNTCGDSPYITSSLTRGWVCHLQLLLGLASALILGSESRGTRDHILLSQIRDFSFCRLLRLAGLRWRYSTPPPNGKLSIVVNMRNLQI